MSTIPFERSFASYEDKNKLECWSKDNKDKNGRYITPRDIFKSTHTKYLFNCYKCKHIFENDPHHIISGSWCCYCSNKKLCNDINCKSCFEKSFASYENKDKLDCWSSQNKDKDDNIITPRDVFKSSNKKYLFNCICEHTFESFIYSISNNKWCGFCNNKKLCNNKDCKTCFEKSFASHEKSKYWSDKNKLNPRDVFKSIADNFYFNCECGHVIIKSLNTISSKDTWCGYCNNKELCNDINCNKCFEKSFASHEKSIFWSDKNELKPRDIFKGTHNKYLFNCDCGHEFESMISNISRENDGRWCPFCSGNKLCIDKDCKKCFEKSFASHEKSKYWSDKNELKPRNVFKSTHTKYLFNCKKEHEFKIGLNSVNRGSWCPYCKNKTEQKLFETLQVDFPDLKHQFKEDWCKNPLTNKHLPFDFVLETEKIIIELDGRQHFEQVSNWSTPEEQYERDTYKMECANQNGYSIIRITQEDVLNDTFDWYKMLKESIETIIEKESVENHFISYEEDYTHFN